MNSRPSALICSRFMNSAYVWPSEPTGSSSRASRSRSVARMSRCSASTRRPVSVSRKRLRSVSSLRPESASMISNTRAVSSGFATRRRSDRQAWTGCTRPSRSRGARASRPFAGRRSENTYEFPGVLVSDVSTPFSVARLTHCGRVYITVACPLADNLSAIVMIKKL